MEENKEKNVFEQIGEWFDDNQEDIMATVITVGAGLVVFGIISTISYHKGLADGLSKGLDSIGKMFEAAGTVVK